jgi:hypothetical protein
VVALCPQCHHRPLARKHSGYRLTKSYLATCNSPQCVASARLRAAGNVYSSARRGRRADLGGIFFRSAWEANYARYLNYMLQQHLIQSWAYEPRTFWFERIRRGTRSYLPDFRVIPIVGEEYFVEIKGWMDAKSKTRLVRMAKYYPNIDLRVVDAKGYRAIEKLLGHVIPGWEFSRHKEI